MNKLLSAVLSRPSGLRLSETLSVTWRRGMMDIPIIQAETAISDFMETPLSLHHSGICTLSSSLSTLTSSSPSRREAETGIWKLLSTPVQSLRRAALESGVWNLSPHPPGKSGIWNLESGISATTASTTHVGEEIRFRK